MGRLTLAYFAVVFACAVSASADDSGKVIAERVKTLTAETVWKAAGEIPLKFDAYHPQGMAIVNGEFFVSSVEVINRAKAQGKGHVFRLDQQGNLLAHVELTDGVRYHPGGIDFDGKRLWVPVAEYRPDSTSVVYTLDPKTFASKEEFRISDHVGAIAYDPISGLMIGATWGSRRFIHWQAAEASNAVSVVDAAAFSVPNHSHYIDLQDAHWLPETSLMLCAGLRGYRGPGGNFALGGLELIDMPSQKQIFQVPVPLWEPGGRPMTQNAFAAEATETGLRFYFLPADGQARIYIYAPEISQK